MYDEILRELGEIAQQDLALAEKVAEEVLEGMGIEKSAANVKQVISNAKNAVKAAPGKVKGAAKAAPGKVKAAPGKAKQAIKDAPGKIKALPGEIQAGIDDAVVKYMDAMLTKGAPRRNAVLGTGAALGLGLGGAGAAGYYAGNHMAKEAAEELRYLAYTDPGLAEKVAGEILHNMGIEKTAAPNLGKLQDMLSAAGGAVKAAPGRAWEGIQGMPGRLQDLPGQMADQFDRYVEIFKGLGVDDAERLLRDLSNSSPGEYAVAEKALKAAKMQRAAAIGVPAALGAGAVGGAGYGINQAMAKEAAEELRYLSQTNPALAEKLAGEILHNMGIEKTAAPNVGKMWQGVKAAPGQAWAGAKAAPGKVKALPSEIQAGINDAVEKYMFAMIGGGEPHRKAMLGTGAALGLGLGGAGAAGYYAGNQAGEEE